MTPELKPCPFDGGCASQSKVSGLHYVSCGRCQAQTALYRDKQAAITAWNTRKAAS